MYMFVCVCMCVCVYLRWMSSHHPLLSRLHLVVCNGSLAEASQWGEHSLLHLAKPIFHIALCLQTFSQTHLQLHTEGQNQSQLRPLHVNPLCHFSQHLFAFCDQRTARVITNNPSRSQLTSLVSDTVSDWPISASKYVALKNHPCCRIWEHNYTTMAAVV